MLIIFSPMPRLLRIEYPGAICHVMNRGDQREDIFADDDDRRRFRSTLEEACTKTEWQVHAYCLMRNHFHLVVETPQANLVAGMKQAGPKHVGEETRQSDEAKAERIVQNQLNRLGWGPEELERHRTGEPR